MDNRLWRTAAVVAPALVAVIACNDAARVPSAMFVVTDSAGTEIVQNSDVDDPGSVLEVAERFRIGVVDAPETHQFFRISAIALSQDSTVYVANGGTAQVRVFTPTGEFVREFGRRGSGPGEFQHISSILLEGGDVVVVDSRLLRATVLAGDGAVLEILPLQRGAARVLPLRRTPSGWVATLLPAVGFIPRAGLTYEDTARVVLLGIPSSEQQTGNGGGSRIVNLVSYPRVRLHGVAAAGGMVASTAALWHPEPAHAVDGQGNIYVHNGAIYNIDAIDLSGRMVRRIRRKHSPVVITSDLLRRYAARVRTFYDTSSVEYPVGRAADYGRLNLPHPATFPVLGRILVSRDGHLWVERPDRCKDPVQLEFSVEGEPDSVWDLFEPSGKFIGTVELPGSFFLRAVMPGLAVGVVKDELGVEYVVAYDIARVHHRI